MAELNQDVLNMIEQIRARLVDLEEDVRSCSVELPGMATRLDRIDDRIYLLETEVASRADAAAKKKDETADEKPADQEAQQDAADKSAASESGESAASQSSKSSKSSQDDDDNNGMNILTPEAKEAIGETVGDLREIGRTGLETISELNAAFSDITGPFKTFTRMGRR